MRNFLINNIWPLFIFLIAITCALYFVLTREKHALHLSINEYVGNPVIDTFFFYITYLGDGAGAAFILLAIMCYNMRLGFYTTASFLTASIFSIFLKEFFFDDENRPFFIFSYIDKHQLNLVEGVDVHIHNSFPSGHATQAFSILMCLAFISNKNYIKFIFLLLALLTSFSRVYLSQHWLVDVVAGSCIGMGFSILYYFIFASGTKFQQFNKSIFELRKS